MAAPLPTREDLFDIGARELLARSSLRPPGQRVTRKAVYTTGTNVNSALAAGAAMADEVVRHMAIRYGELFLDSAEDAALDRLIVDHIDPSIRRKQPSRAVVPLTFARSLPPSNGSPFPIPAGQVFETSTGISFRTLHGVNFATNGIGPITIDAEATVAGTVGNVDENTITKPLQTLSDAGVTVTNLEVASGGDDTEASRDFLARARLAKRGSAKGVVEAIRLGALSTSGVKTAQVIEEVDENGFETGLVKVYISDAAGRANSLLVERVKKTLREYRGAGIVPYITGSTAIYEPISYLVGYQPDTDKIAANAQLRALTVTAVSQLANNETLQRSMLFAIARKVSGLIVGSDAIVLPTTDITPGTMENIKTRTDLVLVNGE